MHTLPCLRGIQQERACFVFGTLLSVKLYEMYTELQTDKCREARICHIQGNQSHLIDLLSK